MIICLAFDNTADGGYVLGCFSASGISGNKTEPNYGYNDYWVIKTAVLEI